MAFKYFTTDKLKLTPAVAKKHMELEAANMDRDFKHWRVAKYLEEHAQGKFRFPLAWIVAVVPGIKGEIRVDGKHTSTMFSAMPEEQIGKNAQVLIHKYQCDTLADVADLYKTVDSANTTRRPTDLNHSYAATVPELKGIHAKIMDLAVSALAWAANPGSPNAVDAGGRAERVLRYVPAIQWLNALLGGEENASQQTKDNAVMLKRAPLLGVAINTWLNMPEWANEFWCLVRDENNADRNSGDRELARWLHEIPSKGSPGTSNKKYTGRQMYVKGVRAWNAWMNGTPTQLMFNPKARIPELVFSEEVRAKLVVVS